MLVNIMDVDDLSIRTAAQVKFHRSCSFFYAHRVKEVHVEWLSFTVPNITNLIPAMSPTAIYLKFTCPALVFIKGAFTVFLSNYQILFHSH